MPKVNPSNAEQSLGNQMERSIEEILPQLVITSVPVFIAGVNRKVNVGNFENVDIFSALALPIAGASMEDLPTLQKMVEDTATLAFAMVSEETGSRYTMIKNLQKGGRPTDGNPGGGDPVR